MSVMLSVIVPMYNPGEFLIPFLNSLASQTMIQMEVIIVNDGSTDGSQKTVEEYAKNHKNFRVIHQNNKGVSEARNTGIRIASGKYISFPDSDDELHPEMYEVLCYEAEKNNLDIMQCNGERRITGSESARVIFPYERLKSTTIIKGVDWLEEALQSRRFLHVVWLAVYNLDFIRRNDLYFEPELHHQDIPWTTNALILARQVKYTDRVLYWQNIHNQSVSNRVRVGSENVFYQRHYMRICEMLVAINRFYQKEVKHRPALYWQITHEALSICHSARREPEIHARKQIATEFFGRRMHQLMWVNARGLQQRWHVLLWLRRMYSYL